MEISPRPHDKGTHEVVNQEGLDSFIADLERYDLEHGRGAWLGRSLGAAFGARLREGKKEDEDEDGGEEAEEHGNETLDHIQSKIQANLTLEDLLGRHNKTLEKLGLELESPNKEGDYDENETYAIGQIKLNIVDKDKFLGYLKSVGAANESQKKILGMAAGKLSLQVKKEYSLVEADDRLLELFSGLKGIVEEYERLGLVDDILEFKNYIRYGNTGLREYILARNNHIFEPIGEGFNLSTYQRDAAPEYLAEYWNEQVFETLKKIKQNPKARELYQEVVKYAADCIAFAEKDPSLSKRETQGKAEAERVQKLREVIQMMKEKLALYTKP